VLIRRAEVEGRAPRDVRIASGRVAEIGEDLAPRAGEPVVDAAGGALLPGLHDHHLHLRALAAAQHSVACGPPTVCDRDSLARALARAAAGAPPGTWIRGVGYHESVAGPLDRLALDALAPAHPVRIQHRSGELWMLNSAACRALGSASLRAEEPLAFDRSPLGSASLRAEEPLAFDRSPLGSASLRAEEPLARGRLFRADAWLRSRLPKGEAPPLRETCAMLARFGVTGVTDASPENGPDELAAFALAMACGELPQRVVLMGRAELPESDAPRLVRGPRKVRLAESALPRFDDLVAEIEAAHAASRPVAIHSVTRAELVFAAVALQAAGTAEGDRIEHASVAPPDALSLLAALHLTVVTQPGFIATRGDAYRRDVAEEELPYLYRCRGFLASGIPLGGSTDAPFGDPDPWSAMRAAVDRLAPDGLALGIAESLSPERALALFTSPADAPGAPARRVAPGAPADLCLLDRPWAAARRQLECKHVVATWCDGRLIASQLTSRAC
jgi:predicted amidohydrolase YtcJ